MTKAPFLKTLTPKLRFPQFSTDGPWRARRLGDLCEQIVEKVSDARLTPVSITAGRGFVSQAEKFGRDISGAQYKNYVRLRRGEFAYNKGNSNRYPQGFVCQLKEFDEAAASNAFICFRLKNGNAPTFFEGLFEKNTHGLQLLKFLTSGARSNGLLNIKADEFFSISLLIPQDPAEQQKIGACLTSLDELLAAEGRKLEALRAHKKGLMQQLFLDSGEYSPRLRFSEFREAGHWKTRKIGSILSKKAEAKTLDPDAIYREIGVRSHGKGLFHKEPVLGNAIGDKRVFHVVPDALVINIVFAWEQALAVTTPEEIGFIASHRFPMFVPIDNRCDVNFMQRLFLTPIGKELLKVASPGGAGRNRTLSQKEFENLDVLIPQTAEQQRIAECFSALDSLIAAQSRKIDGLQTHKKGLMQQIFPQSEDE